MFVPYKDPSCWILKIESMEKTFDFFSETHQFIQKFLLDVVKGIIELNKQSFRSN